ncbi:taste receptor type 2 member 60-like [Tiliqua scincoides]|uniref:taste receptor type 2 member 60-like n=1 Tax=Tiliqua scincoides TaxID=71010 RepID=UPI00346321B4
MGSRNTTQFAVVLLFILGVESIIAFLGNGFIIVVNGHRWLQSTKMLPCDLLLTTLGTTRFLWQSVVMTSQFLNICSPGFFCQSYLWEIGFGVFTYSASASIWCGTWLSVFYFVKVTSFAHRLFLWLKPRIYGLVPRLLGLSLTVFSFPFAASGLRVSNYCNSVGNMTGNASQGEENNYQFWIFSPLHFTFITINVSICLTASILLLISLWRHTRNLKRSGIATKDFNAQAHINVVNSLLSFLFFYILYAVAFTTSLGYSPRPDIVEGLFADIALSLCPSVHSIILVLTNPKLKEVCIRILKIK